MDFDKFPSFLQYANEIMNLRYSHSMNGRKESWEQICRRVCYYLVGKGRRESIKLPNSIVKEIEQAAINREIIFSGRTLRNTGMDYHQINSCYCLRAEDSKEQLGELIRACTIMFMSGGGVGVEYSNLRPYGTPLKQSGGIGSGPIPFIELVNAAGAAARQGGERRGAIHAALAWNHKDIQHFIDLKTLSKLDHTNMSVRFDNEWLNKYKNGDSLARFILNNTLEKSCKYGDPNFQFDSDNQILRNACTEVIASDSYENCCLISINIAAISSIHRFNEVCQLATIACLCASEYSSIPLSEIKKVRDANRRLGVGIMGVGEWFIERGVPYGDTWSIEPWMQVYKSSTNHAADKWSSEFNMARPIAVRAIAPTGTISIVGGHTTPGIEPVFHTAYLRTYNTLKERISDEGLRREKVIDPVIIKLLKKGVNVDNIDTAYTLSQSIEGIKRRLHFQAFVQKYVDNGISTTINLPAYEEGIEQKIKPILLEYLPQLRGVTFYPDGRHKNQPVQPISIKEALQDEYTVDQGESCKGGVCGN